MTVHLHRQNPAVLPLPLYDFFKNKFPDKYNRKLLLSPMFPLHEIFDGVSMPEYFCALPRQKEEVCLKLIF